MQHALGVEYIMKITCPICKGSGKSPVTQQPKAESHGEETIGECPTSMVKESSRQARRIVITGYNGVYVVVKWL